MYGIALSVDACLRGGTRADVAWCLDTDNLRGFDPADAIAITPGGGRLGSLLGGALDSRLIELSLLDLTEGRVVTLALDPIEAATLGVEPGTEIRIAYAPAQTLPSELWPKLIERRPVTLALTMDGDRITDTGIIDTGIIDTGITDTGITDGAEAQPGDQLICRLKPTTMLVIHGGGPMADALAAAGNFVGWKIEGGGGTEAAVALATSLSPIDGLVVMGHDTEAVGRVLETALRSRAGYIGSIGPLTLQQDRADWLAYRGITDTGRVHAPAGIDIGASSPQEVALSVVVEMIATLNQRAG